ncbi:MAG: dihydrolipoyllysine-residue acetyltransferase [Halieaceae bacterium]
MAKHTITVPDIGGAEDAEVIEVSVAVGDKVELEQGLIVLESDKASMEIPAEQAGTVLELLVKEGDTLAEGAAILVLETDGAAAADEPVTEEPVAEPAAEPEPQTQAEPAAEAAIPEPAGASSEQVVVVPDIGTEEEVEVIEISAAVGDTVAEGDSLVVLESDKASMEIPAPFAGELVSFAVKEGDQVSQGAAIATLRTTASASPGAAAAPVAETSPAAADKSAAPAVDKPAAAGSKPASASVGKPATASDSKPATASDSKPATASGIYAGPAVRKLAREFGVDLASVSGSGPKGRVLKEDLQDFVKNSLRGGTAAVTSGSGIPPIPAVDFAAFGEVDIQPMSKMDKLTAANMQRSWLNVPHVTQFDEADITELEDFRAGMKAEAEKRGVKLTPLPFLLKACAVALKDNPKLNLSLASDGENFVYKQYVHIGMAVDTPAGLLVPVIRDVDKKSLWELAAETAELAQKAKERKLKPGEMQGGCFTISSLGGIGGTGFTPIVNAPEVAILGVSKLAVKPVWSGSDFEPRKMLPLCLSYDHRAVNGGDGGRFMTQLGSLLGDIRRLLL